MMTALRQQRAGGRLHKTSSPSSPHNKSPAGGGGEKKTSALRVSFQTVM